MLRFLALLFQPNYETAPETLRGVRGALIRISVVLAILTLAALVALSGATATPGSVLADVQAKAFWALLRVVLAVVGIISGAGLGYVVFQAVESSRAGSASTHSHVQGETYHEGAHVAAAKVSNRGLLLAVCVGVGALVLGFALSGAGAR